MEIARRIMACPAMVNYVEYEMSPGVQLQTDQEWLEFACSNDQIIYHPLGTCRMGEDDAAVVDTQLRVRGLACLRVVDASDGVWQHPRRGAYGGEDDYGGLMLA